MEFRYGDFDGVPPPQFWPNSVRSSFPPFHPPPPPPYHDSYFPPFDAAYEPYDYRYFSSLERMLEHRPRSEEPPSNHNSMIPYRPNRDPFIMDREYERERIREEVLREEVYRRYIEEEVRRRIIKEEVRREIEMEHYYYNVRYPNLGYQGAHAQHNVQFERPGVSYGCYANGSRNQVPCNRYKGRRNIKNVTHKIVEISEDELAAKLPVGGEKVMASNEEEIQKGKDKAAVQTAENGNKVESISITDTIVLKKAKKRKIERKKRVCTLCKASIYNERDWLSHLNGNRHSNKLRELEMNNKKTSFDDADSRKTSGVIGLEAVKIEMENDDSSNGNLIGKQPQTVVRLRKIQVGREVHEVVEKNNRLWCEECQYNCTTTVMMTIHLVSERHKVNCHKL